MHGVGVFIVLASAASVSVTYQDPWQVPTQVDFQQGTATFYALGVMEKVARYRGFIDREYQYPVWLKAKGYEGAVAGNSAGDLGRKVWILGPKGLEGPFLVIDCAQQGHYGERVRLGHIVEVDYQTALRWDMLGGPMPVRVYWVDPTETVADALIGTYVAE